MPCGVVGNVFYLFTLPPTDGIIGPTMDMIAPPTKYLFRMDCWEPETLPAKRMAQYLDKLATLFGETDFVHFLKVRPGSHRQFLMVEEQAAKAVYLRLVGGTSVAPDPETASVRNDINRMLMEDGGVGYVKADPGPRIINFPGRKTPISEEVTIHESGELTGSVVRVGGRSRNEKAVPITMLGDGEYYPCRASKDVAKRLAGFLFEGEIKVSGKGKWTRGGDGVWELQQFDIKDFAEIEAGSSLSAFVDDMRKVEGSGWNSADDAQAELRKLRDD